MKESQIEKLRLQLDEAIQMLRLVAAEQRTTVEITEWLDQNYPVEDDTENKPLVDLLLRTGPKNAAK